MEMKKGKIDFVNGPCPIIPRKLPVQNIILRLRRREIIGCQYPGTQVLTKRKFYQNVFPNYTVLNAEKPPCFLRKFSPDGKYLLAFSADLTSIEIYKYQGPSAAAELLVGCKGEFIGHKNDNASFHIRNNIFHKFFKKKRVINIIDSDERLNRECCLFTDDSRYVIVGSVRHISDELRPHFYQIYSNNEALAPTPISPLEDYCIYLVDIKTGQFCDYRRFVADKIYLSYNQGVYLYKEILAVLSVQHQTIHIFQVIDGLFVDIRKIGRFCLEDESYIVASTAYPDINTRPFKDKTTNTLKHKLLAHLYKRAANVSKTTGSPYELRRFYQCFEKLNSLRMSKMQLLDRKHILIRYVSEDIATLQIIEPQVYSALFVVYDMVSAKIIDAYDNNSSHMRTLFEKFNDSFRNADTPYMRSPLNNIYHRLIHQRYKLPTKRLLSQLPISAQSYSSSPYLDLSLFYYDEKIVQMIDRPTSCVGSPVRFYARDSELLRFCMRFGILGERTTPVYARRLVALAFHPTDPFAISVQLVNTEYITSFHFRHV
ncbi:DET1 homolog [Microplitis mediator]|uniref:DET1 homolog n=1 Tax=Microplitis mediator TaxID=375433 RepID=UPI0025536E44|nr:DET1 homolog [Microplitis mediator]